MIRKFLLGAALTGAMLYTASVIAQQTPHPSQPGQQAVQAKSVTGKIAAIGNGGHSFTLEVSSGNSSDPKTMDFVLDNHTEVSGQVRVGTPVTVVYQIAEGGQNVAVSVTAEG
jgi:hypothetical protein